MVLTALVVLLVLLLDCFTCDFFTCFGFGFVLEGRLLQSDALGNPLWSGGYTGPEGSLLILPVLALTALVIVRSFLRMDAAASA